MYARDRLKVFFLDKGSKFSLCLYLDKSVRFHGVLLWVALNVSYFSQIPLCSGDVYALSKINIILRLGSQTHPQHLVHYPGL